MLLRCDWVGNHSTGNGLRSGNKCSNMALANLYFFTPVYNGMMIP